MNDALATTAGFDEFSSARRRSSVTSVDDLVVLLDSSGRPSGTARKSTVHSHRTPLHLALSCYVVRTDGRVLLTRRSASKRTWPGVWTNACCGHPRPGEAVEDAVRRHLRDELGIGPDRLDLDDDGVDACREAIRSSGAVASIERLIDAKIEEAHAAVADLPFAAQAQLVGVAELIAHRQV